jgi:2-polyprenyl-3-methyl-5-hydroxy-6-metoxy-1,4-benzoquinol methylase
MLKVDVCIACGQSVSLKARGMVAPFLARRIWDKPPFDVDLMGCEQCGLLFFNRRLDATEEEALYRDYRSIEYQRARLAVEPWYTARFNANLTNPLFMEGRRTRLAAELKEHLFGRTVRRVLDFGGDKGGLVRNLLPGAAAFVYDISAVNPEDGVTALRSLDECRAMEFDLILNSNVLEHVADPGGLLGQIQSIAAPNTLVFIEVPFESPLSQEIRLRRLAQIAVLTVLRPRVGWRLASPRGLCLMHEHVNYFGEESLLALVQNTGFRVIDYGHYRWRGPAGGDTMGWCLVSS